MKRNWEFLVNIFSKINNLKDESQKEYILYQLAKQYDISIESLEKIFALYQEQVERERLKSEIYLFGSLFVKLESWLDIIHHRLKMMAILDKEIKKELENQKAKPNIDCSQWNSN